MPQISHFKTLPGFCGKFKIRKHQPHPCAQIKDNSNVSKKSQYI